MGNMTERPTLCFSELPSVKAKREQEGDIELRYGKGAKERLAAQQQEQDAYKGYPKKGRPR